MTTHILHLDLGGQQHERLLNSDTAELAADIHHHARGILGSGRCDIEPGADGLTGIVRSHGAIAGTFTIEAIADNEAAPVDTSAPDHIRHGYTLRDLNRMARAACVADRTYSSDMTTRYDTAWSAIAEHLVAAEEPPARQELVRVGWQAIYREVRAVQQLYGVDRSERAGDVASAPRFTAYWTHIPRPPDEGIIERIAVPQILATLWDVERDAVLALAVHNDYQRAADSLGISYKALVRNINAGRKRFKRRWYAPETALPVTGTDRRVGSHARGLPTHCPRGHEYTSENTIRRPSALRRRICRSCDVARDAARKAARKAGAA